MNKILIVVDMQKDFVDGSLGSAQALAIAGNVRNKIAEYQARGDIIIFTRDTHQADYLNTREGRSLPVEHCIIGTEGWEIYGDLDKNCAVHSYLDKDTFGWRYWRDTLAGLADGAAEIELVGLCTDICVVSNALIIKACFPETAIAVDAACCAGITEESHNAALLTMRMCQVNVING